MPRTPLRTIVQGEALAWLDDNPAPAGASVITSLPDRSELPDVSFDEWRSWFVSAARRVMRWVPEGGAAIFFQSDIRHEGVWIDKGYLVMRAAEAEGQILAWHRIVCRAPPGTPRYGRASYSHLLCVARRPLPPTRRGFPDVLPSAGFMPWSKAMGVEACRLACAYLLEATEARVVVDPFCGYGTALAVANTMGLDAIGVDLSSRKCRAARRLRIDGAGIEAEPGADSMGTPRP